jgi:serpin B
MPKFSTDFKIDLKDTFKALGLGAIFTGTINDLVDSFEGDVFVSDVLQKAHIEVDEEGTKAAAVTAEIMAGTGMPLENDDPPFEMILDHPFVYVIEVGGTPIFIGAVSAL